ncbi:hypothetical protein GQ53DRAFT_834080 [Thozetella sp. PMI_491]|nr:hypothetical protein GQ53DRAFT_834080 [Thozetella sp. PMI_491]
MAVVDGAQLPLGINGVRVYNEYLYWTNTFAPSIYRLRITPGGHRTPGAVSELISHVATAALDHLYFGPGANDIIWTPTNVDNMLLAVEDRVNGTATVVDGAAGELTVAGSTACRFGRGPEDGEILYVVTSEAQASPANGTITEGAKVVAVDISSYVSESSKSQF